MVKKFVEFHILLDSSDMLKNGWVLLNRRVQLFEYDEYELCKYVVIRWEPEVLLDSSRFII